MVQRGFFRSLFDISFTSLITTKIIKVVYVLYMVVIGLVAAAFVVSAFHSSVAVGVIVLVVAAPILSLLYLIFGRVFLEAIIALFRVMENTSELVRLGGGQATSAPSGSPASGPVRRGPPPPGPSAPPPVEPPPFGSP